MMERVNSIWIYIEYIYTHTYIQNDYIVRTFANVTMNPQNNNIIKKKKI
jgi:hypothetical protein